MRSVKRPSKVLRGLSFEISDLILIKDRSEAHDLRMVVQLDYGSDVEEYKEVLASYSATSPQLQWMMWRNACAVFVRSIDGRGGRYRSAAQAIDALVRKAGAILTNIKATQTQPPYDHYKPISTSTLQSRYSLPDRQSGLNNLLQNAFRRVHARTECSSTILPWALVLGCASGYRRY